MYLYTSLIRSKEFNFGIERCDICIGVSIIKKVQYGLKIMLNATPQLREKMADLYAKIASSYDVPSNNELENMSLIETRFNKAQNNFKKLKNKAVFYKDLNLKTFDEFIKQ